MSFVPDRKLLSGLSVEVAEMYGKPHINAWYARHNDGLNSYRFDHDKSCPICGDRATNVHHCPPKSKGKFVLHGHILKPSLFALCGSGVQGCHGKIHKREIIPRWKWYDDEYAYCWWSGELLDKYGPHNDLLYMLGTWEFVEKN